MDVSDLRQIVTKIKTNLFKKSNFYSIGVLKSHFRGSGLKFKEHRVYTHGDDVRFIDWKILAKTSVPYIKTFEEERNVEITVLLDAGPTMFTGSDGISKLQAGVELCCLLYLIAAETKDFVQVVLFYNGVRRLPRLNGDKGIAVLISTLESCGIMNPNGDYITENIQYDDKDIKLSDMMRYFKKKKEVVILSDLNNQIKWEQLTRFSSYSNMHCFRLTSPLDRAIESPYLFNTNSKKTIFPTFGKVMFRKDEKKEQSKLPYCELRVDERYLESFVKNMI